VPSPRNFPCLWYAPHSGEMRAVPHPSHKYPISGRWVFHGYVTFQAAGSAVEPDDQRQVRAGPGSSSRSRWQVSMSRAGRCRRSVTFPRCSRCAVACTWRHTVLGRSARPAVDLAERGGGEAVGDQPAKRACRSGQLGVIRSGRVEAWGPDILVVWGWQPQCHRGAVQPQCGEEDLHHDPAIVFMAARFMTARDSAVRATNIMPNSRGGG
jgi:hypothetical protein